MGNDTTRRARGTGSVKEVRPNVWRVRVGCGRKADGSLRQKQETVRGSRAAAEHRAEQLYQELTENIVTGSKYTLAQYYERRVLPLKKSTSQANQDGYRFAWKHVPEEWKRGELRELTKTEVERWVASLSHGTARACVRHLRAILRQAYGDGLLKREPMAYRVKMPKRPSRGSFVWDEQDIADALVAVRGEDIEPYLLITCGTGCRREEALALDWEDLEWDNGGTCWVTIDSAYTETDGEHGTKTETSVRRVPVVGYIANRLHELRATGAMQQGRTGRLTVGGLRRRWDNLWRPGGKVRKNVVRPDGALLDADVPKIAPNALRHSHITLMSELEITERVSNRFHGHANEDTQARHYIRRYDKRMLAAARKVAAAIDECVGAL